MNDPWLGLCAVLALAGLLWLIIRGHVHGFVALLLVSLGLGLAGGLPPDRVVDAIQKGIGDILREVTLLLALGAMLGRMLEASGAAELIARRLIAALGERRASVAILLAAFVVGLPILFNVAFLVLVPITWRLQKQSGRSLLYYLLPLGFGLSLTHSLVPPHPGIVGAVQALGRAEPERVMVETIVFGTLLSLPIALFGWLGPGRWWAARQFVPAPESLTAAGPADPVEGRAESLPLALAIVLAPLALSVIGFGGRLMRDLHYLPAWLTESPWPRNEIPSPLTLLVHPPLAWVEFLGKPAVALLVPTALAFWAYGVRRGWDQARLAKLTGEALADVGPMLFLFGTAGGFKEVIQATGVGRSIAEQAMLLPLTPVGVGFLVAALVRAALGSATASILTASALLTGLAEQMPGRETLLVLSVACGTTVMTQPADSGFWMLKEYGNLSVRDVMVRFNACRILMALFGTAILLAYEAWF
jgi:GntP family gluconate:H+ symporter/Gnt-I system low-affinity gluconate transporter